jgi:hypothetical protein
MQRIRILVRLDFYNAKDLRLGTAKALIPFVREITHWHYKKIWLLRQLKRCHKNPHKKGVGERPNLSFE